MLSGKVNWNPNVKQLRNFGKIAIAATAIIAILLYTIKGLAVKWCLLLVAGGLLIFLCSRISIKLTKAIYLGLTILTFPIGIAVSFILMSAFYFLLLTPIGLFFRLIGRDSLSRKFDRSAKTYWTAHQTTDNTKRYFQQF